MEKKTTVIDAIMGGVKFGLTVSTALFTYHFVTGLLNGVASELRDTLKNETSEQ